MLADSCLFVHTWLHLWVIGRLSHCRQCGIDGQSKGQHAKLNKAKCHLWFGCFLNHPATKRIEYIPKTHKGWHFALFSFDLAHHLYNSFLLRTSHDSIIFVSFIVFSRLGVNWLQKHVSFLAACTSKERNQHGSCRRVSVSWWDSNQNIFSLWSAHVVQCYASLSSFQMLCWCPVSVVSRL